MVEMPIQEVEVNKGVQSMVIKANIEATFEVGLVVIKEANIMVGELLVSLIKILTNSLRIH